jgi:hypothetical protein
MIPAPSRLLSASRRTRRLALPLLLATVLIVAAVYASVFFGLSSKSSSPSSLWFQPQTDQHLTTTTTTHDAMSADADAANAAAALQPSETPTGRCTRILASIEDGSLAASGITKLDLSGCNLTELPDAIGTLSSLQFLNLGKNPLSALPSTFTGLTSLRILFFLGCEFTAVPEAGGLVQVNESSVVNRSA